MKAFLGLLIAVLAVAVPAQAQNKAGDLASNCKAYVAASPETMKNPSEMPVQGTLCLGYVAGWMDAINGVSLKFEGKYMVVLFADDVTVGQAIRVFVKFMSAHPEFENKTADQGLGLALVDAKLLGFKPVTSDSREQ